MKDLTSQLQQRKTDGLYRSRRIAESPQQVEMIVDGHKVINFCSNDYLGLANHASIKQALIDGVNQYGVGSGAAHLVNGHSLAHHQLEEKLAAFTGYPRALLFSSGYMANLGVAQALMQRGDTVFEDRLNHASLIDAGLHNGIKLIRYAHNNTDELSKKLASVNAGQPLVMTDGVFSMDGDIAAVKQLTTLCQQHHAHLMVDDAHGFGVLGAQGRGSLEHTDTAITEVPVYMATLGKAVGTAGAFVAGNDDLIETLIQFARTYIYTTAQPAAIAHATLESLNVIEHEPEYRHKLIDNIAYFKQCAMHADLPLLNSETAIQPLLIGENKQAVSLSNSLFENGIMVTAIRPPTVPNGTARLRITLSAQHSKTHIESLVDTVRQHYENST